MQRGDKLALGVERDLRLLLLLLILNGVDPLFFLGELLLQSRRGSQRLLLACQLIVDLDYVLLAEDRLGIVGNIDNPLKQVMRDKGELIHFRIARGLPVRKPQPAADGLLAQRGRGGRAQGNDGVQIGYVPSLLEHVHMDDNFDRVPRVFQPQEFLNILVLLAASLVGVDLHDLLGISALEEAVRRNQFAQGRRVFRVLRHHQHKRPHYRHLVVTGEDIEGNLRVLVYAHPVFELDAVYFLDGNAGRIEILAGRHRRDLHKTVTDGLCQGILVHHVLELDGMRAALNLWCGRQFQTQHRLQLVDDLHAPVRTVVMRLIHEKYEIVQP